MFTIKGTINTTHDIEKAKQLSLYDANKVIALVDGNDSSLSALPNISIGSILLPPFIAMENFLNGNYLGFVEEYKRHLHLHEATTLMAVIIASAYFGYNVVVYIPQEQEDNFKFTDIFKLHFGNSFGIYMGDLDTNMQDSYTKSPHFDAVNLNLLYFNDLITGYDFLRQYPVNTDFSEYILRLLQADPILVGSLSMTQYSDLFKLNAFFKNYVRVIRQTENQTELKSAIIRN